MLQAALACLRRIRGARRADLELDLVLAKATVLRSLNGYSAPEVEELLGEARQLCIETGDVVSRFNVEWGLFQCMIVKGDMPEAQRLTDSLHAHAERHPERPVIDAHLASGMAALNRGDFEGARRFLELGVSGSDPHADPPHLFTHGQNPGLFCLSYLARAQCFLGQLEAARANLRRCLAISAARAQQPGHAHTHVNALAQATRVHHLCGDVAEERWLAAETIAFARTHQYAYYEAVGVCHLGWVIGVEESLPDGIERMAAGIAALAGSGNQLGQLGYLLMLAQLLLRAGRAAEAAEALQKAVRLNRSGLAVWDAEIERVRGDVLASPGFDDPAGAEAAYRASIAVAERQRAALLTCRAATRLADLLRRLGRDEEAAALLAWSLGRMPEPGSAGALRWPAAPAPAPNR
jgi:predicted ATPase